MPKRAQEPGYEDQDKRAVRLVNTHHLEADEAKHDGDVVEVLPRRASALIQQGYAEPAEGNQRSKRK